VPSTASVAISGFSFQPGNVTIRQGGTVTWTNNDNVAHTVTFSDNTGSAQLQQGGTYSRQFNTTGVYNYRCSIHPYMTGVVTVV
jgi:plastocyanin